MPSPPPPRTPHPCVARRCGHAADHHVATPELAGRDEVVIWCAACRRHEVRRGRRFRHAEFPSSRAAGVTVNHAPSA